MYVYVGNLPALTTEKALSKFARLPMGSRTRIIKRQDARGATIQFGLIYSRKERHGHKIISRLDGSSCRGHALQVHEYCERSRANDRRNLGRNTGYRNGQERRVRERRASVG